MAEARFCRRCGQPSNTLSRGSVTEVTTRRLGTPGAPFMPGENVAGQHPLEQYGGQTRAALSADTKKLAPASKVKRWLPLLLLLCVVVLIPTAYLLGQWRQPTRLVRPPTRPPAVPPKPPQNPASAVPVDPRFVYPGASKTMVMSRAGEGDVVQLQTADGMEKVADWYIENLKPEKTVRLPESVILKSGDVGIVITPNGSGSNIMLRQGAD
ncbi:MAG: hypothetical protein ICV60_04585 [Pyrinomonadaceae bacterium]|nr:hypothetical protein [Pyrinomonadaceae bacterium]